MIRAAEYFNSQFLNIEIELLGRPDINKNPGKHGFYRTIARVSNTPTPTRGSLKGSNLNVRMDNLMGEEWNEMGLWRKYQDHQKTPLQVHAEIQIFDHVR